MLKIEVFYPGTKDPETSEFVALEQASQYIQNRPLATKVRFTAVSGGETIRAAFNPRVEALAGVVANIRDRASEAAQSRPRGKAVKLTQKCEFIA